MDIVKPLISIVIPELNLPYFFSCFFSPFFSVSN